jgi:serine/threonine-protein kinase
MAKATLSANAALRMDDTLAESHASMALASHIYGWEWEAAEQHYRRAIELNAHFATAHHWHAIFLAEMGRANEAIVAMKHAQGLDPVSLIIGADAGMVLYLARHYERGVEQCRATLDMDSNYFRARMWLGCCLEQKGLYQEAIAEYETARTIDDSPYVLEWLARAHAMSGNGAEANRLVEHLADLAARVYVDSYYLASVYAALGRKEEAVKSLLRACVERSCWLSRVRVDPIFDSLRAEAGFNVC